MSRHVGSAWTGTTVRQGDAQWQLNVRRDHYSDADDATTADLFTQVSRQMDMDLWFLEAHLQAKR